MKRSKVNEVRSSAKKRSRESPCSLKLHTVFFPANLTVFFFGQKEKKKEEKNMKRETRKIRKEKKGKRKKKGKKKEKKGKKREKKGKKKGKKREKKEKKKKKKNKKPSNWPSESSVAVTPSN